MKNTILNGRILFGAVILSSFLLISCEKEANTVTVPRSKEYQLAAVGGSGVTGKVTFSENSDKSFNVLVALDYSVKDTVHVLHIHNGMVGGEPGNIAIPLNSITGTGGAASSLTQNINSAVLPDSTTKVINYDSILVYNGYLNVHYSQFRIDSLIAQGNVGKN